MFRTAGGIIKSEMRKRGYKHRSAEDQFSVRGQYAQNLQYVYAKEHSTPSGLVVDLLYFAVDIQNEKLIMGLYRENMKIENGVLINASRSISLTDFSVDRVSRELDKLIPEVWHGNAAR